MPNFSIYLTVSHADILCGGGGGHQTQPCNNSLLTSALQPVRAFALPKITASTKLAQAAKILILLLRFPIWFSDGAPGSPNRNFCGFHQSLEVDARIVLQVAPQPLHSSLPVDVDSKLLSGFRDI